MADKTKTININGNPYTVGEESMWELPDMTDTVFAATISALNQVIFDTKNRIIEITGEIDSIDEIQHNFGQDFDDEHHRKEYLELCGDRYDERTILAKSKHALKYWNNLYDSAYGEDK